MKILTNKKKWYTQKTLSIFCCLNYFLRSSGDVLGKSESVFNKESVITGVFNTSFPYAVSNDIGVFGTDQSAEAVIKSFRS